VLFAGPGVGVEEFFGEDAVVALDFAVVAWCVGRDPLVAGSAQDAGEVAGAVAGTVVGDDPVDMLDAVAGEERAGAVGEGDRGAGLFVGQGFGVGQAGEPVDRGVQVGVAGPTTTFAAPNRLFGLFAAAARSTSVSRLSLIRG
jgi:hypothetical protein